MEGMEIRTAQSKRSSQAGHDGKSRRLGYVDSRHACCPADDTPRSYPGDMSLENPQKAPCRIRLCSCCSSVACRSSQARPNGPMPSQLVCRSALGSSCPALLCVPSKCAKGSCTCPCMQCLWDCSACRLSEKCSQRLPPTCSSNVLTTKLRRPQRAPSVVRHRREGPGRSIPISRRGCMLPDLPQKGGHGRNTCRRSSAVMDVQQLSRCRSCCLPETHGCISRKE